MSKSKAPAKRADLKKDQTVEKAEVVKKVVKSVGKNAKSVNNKKGAKNVKGKVAANKVVDDEKVAGTGIFEVDLKSLTTRNGKLSIFVVDEYMSLLERADNFPATTLLLSSSNWLIFDRCVNEKDRYQKLMNFVDKAEMDGVERILWPSFCSKVKHFAVIEILLRDSLIRVYDSVEGCQGGWIREGCFMFELLEILRPKKKFEVEFFACRQQGNVTDCGVYAMANTRSLLFGRDVNGEGMPGSHMGKNKETAVTELRTKFAKELTSSRLSEWW